MSMVLFALVMRSTDGLPLSATTDYEQDEGLQETKKQIKTLSEKLSTFPSRCSLKTGKFNIHFTSSLGLGYLVVCTENCPNALAFCFLEEMQSQFLHRCDGFLIRNAVRPYSSSEFDDFLQDTKQRYNSPCSLTSKISLADMQSELKMIPTYQLSPEDLRSCFSRRNVFRYKSITPSQLLEPVSLRGIMSCVLSIFCGGLNLLQGFHAIEGFMQSYNDKDFNDMIAFFLGTAGCLYQFYLFGYFSVRRNSKSFLAFALICLSNICLFELRNVWQILFHVTVAAFMTLQIRLRQLQCKAPDYNV
ncbi:vesicle-trafficking protein SEC22a isoform X1 [Salmo salar]|uniref:Vesicle-trafficking protein SEC22a-like isoform X1 n=1 Tax=Salmo salar TaxID=8030 RepID=A0A1S3PN37_SALSA|nr:vesicle-trafficking protein SEC22a isoform X1 [Salmo salar]XP_014029101.1 vesicle-trafficking protein SEC22a isoform X1 [Salmo salar]XP_014029102.1 vesicle-trafficking protein SEC22a isoform X1 [Salmo salar]XP_014029103.1 vesicle-trafficking protein SEC22a isoform X1 [Salmo salar]|eukprot:XP_014029100.1 PREDICTED: vesicle-trafficking protein SEC22a-like isoform X1 [Salmo salar]